MKTPVLDKMLEVNKESQSIGEFINWLKERGIFLAELCKNRYCLCKDGEEKLLADYFNIDLDEAERERRKILTELQKT